MSKPIIGITTGTSAEWPAYQSFTSYSDAVSRAGGIPVLLPYRSRVEDIPALLGVCRGVVFTGGPDLDPRSWGDELHPATSLVDAGREGYERALVAEVDRRRVPALGVCLGAQLMNVHRGGTLFQHVPEVARVAPAEHRRLGNRDSRHGVQLEAGSHVARIVGVGSFKANSAHHQAIDRVGEGLVVSGRAPDGVVEAIEDPAHPYFLGVQWHPERIIDVVGQENLFRHLVRAARRSVSWSHVPSRRRVHAHQG